MGESKGEVLALGFIFMALPMIAVALRFWAKAMKKAMITYDDHMILYALVSISYCSDMSGLTYVKVFTLGTGVCQLVGKFWQYIIDSHCQDLIFPAGFMGNLGQHITYDANGIPTQLTQLILFLKVR